MRRTDIEVHLSRLETELVAHHARGGTTEADIQDVLHQALRDLHGSVSRDSLPEMVARLAATRLGAPGSKGLALA